MVLPRWSGIVRLFVENPLMLVRAKATKRNVIAHKYVFDVITHYVAYITLVSGSTHAQNRKHNAQQPATPRRHPPSTAHPRAPAPTASPDAP